MSPNLVQRESTGVHRDKDGEGDVRPKAGLSTAVHEGGVNLHDNVDVDIDDQDRNADGFRHPLDDETGADERERKLVRKIDWRLCTIAGILCSLNLLDSGIISSASVTSIFEDLGLGVGNRYSVSILVYTVSSVAFQLPATVAVRILGPRLMFSGITIAFGLITMCTAFINTWQQMVVLRLLLGMSQACVFPGLSYLVSTWYTRKEQQLRFAFLLCGEVSIIGLGAFSNFGLNHLDGVAGLAGWRWMFLVQGLVAMVIGSTVYWWIVDFPENAHRSYRFLTLEEQELAEARISDDRGDVKAEEFSWGRCLIHFTDPKIYGFSALFFLLNLVSTCLSYFLPIILKSGMGFSEDQSILLSAPPYFYAVFPVVLSSIVGDRFQLRSLVIIFNCLCTIVGFCMLGFASQVTVRYVGTYLATGAYVSNWAAMNAYQANNIVGQWKRATFAASITACNGLGGIAGAFIVRQTEAPRYMTAIWISIGSHILIIGIVLCFTLYFWSANRRQRKGEALLERTVGFTYTY
ncbi:major facilitator superfamily transporter [Phlyctema vagabunda]|uniref:Major facilitator superfamily transporter n=1 Tax=Phlyctema vagabunda TaxID=108571 RepID=A0ABR4PDI1_9HELO